jgi:DNA polymerase III epsilon subunit-like protein
MSKGLFSQYRGFAVFDFETTGLKPEDGDRVVQVATVLLSKEGQFQSDWCSFVKPPRPMAATEIHGISDEEVSSSPAFPDLWPIIRERFDSRIVVAHNASFDLEFLSIELEAVNKLSDLTPFPVFDTLRLAHLVEGIPNRRQRSIAAKLGVDPLSKPGRGPHDALTDSHLASEILRYYLNLWPETVANNIQVFPDDFDFVE